MDLTETKALLSELHTSGFGWAMACARRDRTEAEEVLQSVYVKVLSGKAVFRGESSFRTWFFSLIRHTAVDRRRTALLRKVKMAVLATHSAVLDQPRHPDEELVGSETRSIFLEALAKLPRRQQEVLELVFYHDQTVEEAAAIIGVSIGTARQHYERGKKRLRDELEALEVSYVAEWRARAHASEFR